MNDRVFDAESLEPKVLGSPRRVIEAKKHAVCRVPASENLVDLLIPNRLAEYRETPQNATAPSVR